MLIINYNAYSYYYGYYNELITISDKNKNNIAMNGIYMFVEYDWNLLGVRKSEGDVYQYFSPNNSLPEIE